MTDIKPDQITRLAAAVRALSVAMVERAQSGHPGLPLGAADVATVLFARHLVFHPAQPLAPLRDRFILSAGHGSAMLYSLLYLLGYHDFPIDVLQRFRQLHSPAAGHPEYGHGGGIETTTGPLGQGLGNAVGMALGLKKLFHGVGRGQVPRVFVLVGDGCLMEGIAQEVITLAGHLRLDNLVVLFDDNHISIDGGTNLADSTDQQARFRAAGFHTLSVDGHDAVAIDRALTETRGMDRPSFVACRTVIGRGAPTKQGSSAVHGSPLGKTEAMAVLHELGISDGDKFLADMALPANWLADWRQVAANRAAIYGQREQQLRPAPILLSAPLAWEKLPALTTAIDQYKQQLLRDKKSMASRVASQQAIGILVPHLPQLVGGSADLTGSNGTKVAAQKVISKDDYSGHYIHYGVREHGMAAIMNGLALTGSFIPYGGTFLVFSDYLRGALRLSALMRQKVIYIMTHDSIGLGEDGPTHQPIEHLASLRAMPHLLTLRPADSVETIEAWEVALNHAGPSLLALSRQNLPLLRQRINSNLTSLGGYIIDSEDGNGDENIDDNIDGRQLTLMATGSEVPLAVAAATALRQAGVRVAVVSLPCFELFRQQADDYRHKILGTAPRLAIEAGVQQPWHEWLRAGDKFIGLDDFGASGPYLDIYRERGLSEENILRVARGLL